jgi:hypothetical protein
MLLPFCFGSSSALLQPLSLERLWCVVGVVQEGRWRGLNVVKPHFRPIAGTSALRDCGGKVTAELLISPNYFRKNCKKLPKLLKSQYFGNSCFFQVLILLIVNLG